MRVLGFRAFRVLGCLGFSVKFLWFSELGFKVLGFGVSALVPLESIGCKGHRFIRFTGLEKRERCLRLTHGSPFILVEAQTQPTLNQRSSLELGDHTSDLLSETKIPQT